MIEVYYTNFREAAQDLLEIVNHALPGKTLFLTKKLPDAYSIEKVLDNDTGVKIKEGDIVSPENTY
ncbi:hypothetical protein [Neobacillus cucumis]|uniref:hypothetical protein n=1 Tax=Neobacillus cucumis TaxID=1740721 RepID=UPI0028531B2D|nr:hypothetical protein [Neobacillus cucumis]MDR4945401.1 hypothetical protein [Neobacillus cucumis]